MGLILASKSASRKRILEDAGLIFNTSPAPVDETSIKKEMLESGNSFKQIAEKLATEKALYVSKENPVEIILGADQILSCGDKIYSKAKNKSNARQHLEAFRGKKHTLITSIVLVENCNVLWTYTSEPELTMREFSDEFLNEYLEKAGDALYHSVGCYFMEDIGIQLFSDIKGQYFDILGMPLLPLLEKLRELNVIND